MVKKVIPIRMDKELWDRFYAKYRKNSAEQIRELMKQDLEETSK